MFGLFNMKRGTDHEASRPFVQPRWVFDCAVDFKAMRAFAIERMIDEDGIATTVIGYVDCKGDGREWHIRNISDQRHVELVQQFRESRPA
jgi:hypothetical protein